MGRAIDDVMENQSYGDLPYWIRPYTPPLVRSIASGGISPLAPSHAGGKLAPAEHFATEDNATLWTPWVQQAARALSTVFGLGGFFGMSAVPIQTSGPLAGQPTRPAMGVAYSTPTNG